MTSAAQMQAAIERALQTLGSALTGLPAGGTEVEGMVERAYNELQQGLGRALAFDDTPGQRALRGADRSFAQLTAEETAEEEQIGRMMARLREQLAASG